MSTENPDDKFERSSPNTKSKSKDSSPSCSPNCKTLIIPIRIRSEANIQEHWTKKHKRKKQQQAIIHAIWNSSGFKISLPVTIKLIRQAPRTLDEDNLLHGLKWARDKISDLIIPGLKPGRADNMPGLTFEYGQEKSNQYGLKIEIYSDSK